MKNEDKKSYIERTKNERKLFLLSFFNDKQEYEEKKVNNHWLVKQQNGKTKEWSVAIYSEESFKNYKEAHKKFLQFPNLKQEYLMKLEDPNS